MGADLHLDPDVVGRLAGAALRIADDLPAGPPVPPDAAGPGAVEAVEGLARSVREAVSELVAFAGTAEATVRRLRDADQAVASGLRACDPSGVRGQR